MKIKLSCKKLFSMKIFLLFLAMHSYAFFSSHEVNDEKSNLDIVKAYLQARQKSMQENATSEDIDRVIVFYSDSLYYEHVLSAEKKFVFHGKDGLRNGYISHLGDTRNVKIYSCFPKILSIALLRTGTGFFSIICFARVSLTSLTGKVFALDT